MSDVVPGSRYCKPLFSELRRTLFVDVKYMTKPELYGINQLKTGELQRANFGLYLSAFKFKQREIIE